jgi:hypothetical protein
LSLVQGLDGLDLEALEELMASRGWRILADKLKALEAARVHTLDTATENVPIYRAQGERSAYRTAHALPGKMAAELRAELKKAKP